MPSTEERREVAARLREVAPMYRQKGGNPDLLSSLVATVGTSVDSVFDCLADLIEPEPERTCWMEPTRDKPRSKALTLTCSNCGDWHEYRGEEEENKWNFCRKCGFKRWNQKEGE